MRSAQLFEAILACTMKMIETIHSFSTPVIASNHEFHKTPSSKEMVERMCFMQEIGADIVKLAVMPVCAKDVLSLQTV